MTRYVCYHPEHGYARFGSYRKVFFTQHPPMRGMYDTKAAAFKRLIPEYFGGSFYYKDKPISKKELQVRKIQVTYKDAGEIVKEL